MKGFSVSTAYSRLAGQDTTWNNGIRFPRLLRLPTSLQSIAILFNDIVAVALPTLHIIYLIPHRAIPNLIQGIGVTALMVLTFTITLQLAEGYKLSQGHLISYNISTTLRAVITLICFYAVACLFVPSAVLPARSIVIWGLETMALTIVGRELLWRLFSLRRFNTRVIILGAGWAGTEIAETIAKNPRCGVIPIGFVDDFTHKSRVKNLDVLSTFSQIMNVAQRYKPDIAVLAITGKRPEHVVHACHILNRLGIPVTEMPVLFEHITKQVPVQHIGDSKHLYDNGREYSQRHAFFDPLNRIFNFITALILLIVTTPIMLIIALAVALDTRGGVFYVQTRSGLLDREFRCIKFRSMYSGSESAGAIWATEDDPRITRVGNIIRKLRVDELPQLINVLKGEMNLVGPRPERPKFVRELSTQIPFYNRRHIVKPGITGWAQVCYPYANTVEDSLLKLQYDLYYIKYRTFLFELYILIKTIPVVLGLRGM